jgi:hypothetical protein
MIAAKLYLGFLQFVRLGGLVLLSSIPPRSNPRSTCTTVDHETAGLGATNDLDAPDGIRGVDAGRHIVGTTIASAVRLAVQNLLDHPLDSLLRGPRPVRCC